MLQPPLIQVSDQLERRIRKPADALRCVVACIVIIAAVVTAIAASATTAGAETDIVGASRRLPDALANDIPQIARFGLLILPLALAATQLVRRQVRRLVEAFATGVLAGAAAEVANILLERPAAARLYYAIIMAHAGTSHVDALDPYLVGLVAFVTMIGLTGRPGWRNALIAGDRRVRCRPARGVDHDARKRAHDPDHAAGRLCHRHGRPVRCRARRRSVPRPGRSARRCPPGASGGPGTTGT